MIEGIFFDGERSAARPARLELGPPDLVRLTLDQGFEPKIDPPRCPPLWEGHLADVEISERIGNVPRRVTISGMGLFETRDNDAIDRALAALGRPLELVPWLEARWPIAIAALVTIALGSFLFVRYGVPAIADLAARTLPTSVDRLIGARTLALLDDRLLHPSELAPERQAELRERFAGMVADPVPANAPNVAAEVRFEERLEPRAAPALGPNALALPSGIIVVTDELVGLARHDDELVAVLAHELGHVRGRHALRRLFQSVSVSALAFALVGDVSSASALFGAVPALIDARHSRDFEREADGFARAWLVGHGIPPFRFDEILCRMERGGEQGRERASGERWSRYLSTHPTTDERARCSKSPVASDHRAEVRQDLREDVSRQARETINVPASPRTGPPPSPAAPGS